MAKNEENKTEEQSAPPADGAKKTEEVASGDGGENPNEGLDMGDNTQSNTVRVKPEQTNINEYSRKDDKTIAEMMGRTEDPKYKDSVDLMLENTAVATGNANLARSESLQNTIDNDEMKKSAAEAALEVVREQTAAMMKSVVSGIPADVYKARARAESDAEARANTQKTTVPGGRYMVDGRWVNAKGDILAD